MRRLFSSNKQLLWLLLISTFLMKCVLIFLYGHTFDYGSDDRSYLESARILLEKGVFTYNDPNRPTLFIMPALPFMLAAVMKIAGTGFAAEQLFRVVQALLVAGGLYVLYRTGSRIFNEKTSLFAVALISFYPPLWLVSNFIFTEATFTLIVILFFFTVVKAVERPTSASAILFGIVWAAAVYVRPTIALWPVIVFVLLFLWRSAPRKQLVACGLITTLLFVLCLCPWWFRNYNVSGGHFIPLTKAGGNPLLLGTYPFTVPGMFLEEQRAWHDTNNLWVNDELDTKRAIERIKKGFSEEPVLYACWYTIGKLALFWGDVFYWVQLPGVHLSVAVLYHYVLLIWGIIGIWRSMRTRPRNFGVLLLLSLFGYMSFLHMVYLAHSRYSVPLMPFVALFAAAQLNRSSLWNEQS